MIGEIYKFWRNEDNNPQGKIFLKSFCEQKGLNLGEAKKWLKEEFSPGEAKEWMDKGFSLEQAKEWKNNGVRSPEGAEYWKNQNYTPDDVGIKISQIYKGINQIYSEEIDIWKDYSKETDIWEEEEIDIWIKAGFSPGEAAAWKAAGFRSPKEAAAWIFAGFLSPAEAAMWKGAKFFPGEAAAWKAAGFSLSQAIGLRAKYGSPLEALKALKEDAPKKDDSEAWKIFNDSNDASNNNSLNSSDYLSP